MKIIDRGGGTPIVVIPGVQGRWEWMKPAIDALSRRCRVITFSLADEPSCGGGFDEARGFDCYVEQVRDALDSAGIAAAAMSPPYDTPQMVALRTPVASRTSATCCT